MDYTGLKVTAYLVDGQIVTNEAYLPLDALLSRAYLLKEMPEICYQPLNSFDDYIESPIPVEKENMASEDWYYKCSFACFKMLDETKRYYNKRFDEHYAESYVDFKNKSQVVNTRSGKLKNYRVQLNTITTPYIYWYLIGNKANIKELLQYISNIGKKASQGFGRIREWTVEEDAEALEKWKLRAVPNPKGMSDCAIRPLYFNPANQRRCTIPSSEELGCNQVFRGWW